MHSSLSAKTLVRLSGAYAAAVAVLLPAVAHAVTLIHPCATANSTTPPSLNCALLTFGNIAQLILSLTGGFALLMFVYGGFLILSSAGKEENVTKGKEVIRNALIGIAIILFSGYFIRFAMDQLEVQEDFRNPEAGESQDTSSSNVETGSGDASDAFDGIED